MFFRKSLIVACALSVMGFGSAALAQTDPAATPMDPAAGAPAAPDATMEKPMAKKPMMKKHMKKKKMMKKM